MAPGVIARTCLSLVPMAVVRGPMRRTGPVRPSAAALDRSHQLKLARYRAALDAGASPATVAPWIAETEAEKASYALRSPERRPRMTQQEIKFIVTRCG
jgi:hypothetical protein